MAGRKRDSKLVVKSEMTRVYINCVYDTLLSHREPEDYKRDKIRLLLYSPSIPLFI